MNEAGDLLTIPEAKYVPKTGDAPSYAPSIVNFAGKEKTVALALSWIQQYYTAFKSQASRTKFEKEMDVADELTRAAITATQLQADAPEQHDDTATNLTSSSFYRYLRSLSAWESAVLLGNDKDIPVKCDPIIGLQDFAEDEARRQCDYRNIELGYVFNKAELRSKLSNSLYFGNKYANIVLEMFWNEKKEEVTERVQKKSFGAKLKEAITGEKTIVWETKEKFTSQWPDIKIRDIRKCWFDAAIDDAQQQSCVLFVDQYQLAELWTLQKSGKFLNVEKLTGADQFNFDATDSVLNERATNANEAGTDYNVTKLFDVWSGWCRLPIDKNGDWTPSRTLATWFWFAFVGDINATPRCIALTPNPYKNKLIPVKLYHALKDDKGAFHMGYSDLSKCSIAVEMTIMNQAIDNYRQRSRQPLLIEKGSVSIRDKTFTTGGNRVWFYKQGAKAPTEVKIGDTTATMLPLLQEVKDSIQDVFGVNKPFMAEALGGRTSASEALFVTDQAVRVAMEDAKYKADQLLPFVAKWSLDMMDQFSDPETTLIVTMQDKPVSVKPSDVYGPVNIRIVSIKQFQDGILRRREEDDFIGKIYPLMSELMTPKGKVNFFTPIAISRGFDNVDTWFDTTGNFEGTVNARRESNDILWFGSKDLPTELDNDDIHLKEHKPILASYILLPQEQQNSEWIRHMKLHIQMHEENLERKSRLNAATLQQNQQNQSPSNSITPGQEAGAILGGSMGEMANMENPVEE